MSEGVTWETSLCVPVESIFSLCSHLVDLSHLMNDVASFFFRFLSFLLLLTFMSLAYASRVSLMSCSVSFSECWSNHREYFSKVCLRLWLGGKMAFLVLENRWCSASLQTRKKKKKKKENDTSEIEQGRWSKRWNSKQEITLGWFYVALLDCCCMLKTLL